jgi:hypothetical protein
MVTDKDLINERVIRRSILPNNCPKFTSKCRCLLIAVTSVHRVCIYEPVQDPINGNWILIHELTNDVRSFYSNLENSLDKLDALETICKGLFNSEL